MTKLNAERIIENSFIELEKLSNRIVEIHNELQYAMCAGSIEYSGQDECLMEIVDALEEGSVNVEEAMNQVKEKGILDDFEEDTALEK